MKIAVYPGSFDPITNGHFEVLRRAVAIFDKVILLLAVNPEKGGRFSKEERLSMMREATAELPNVSVDSYEGLTVDYARKVGATHLVRGLRAVSDFEYEFGLAAANEFAAPDVDMVFFMAKQKETFVSSSAIVELYMGGVDVSSLVPEAVLKALQKKYPLKK